MWHSTTAIVQYSWCYNVQHFEHFATTQIEHTNEHALLNTYEYFTCLLVSDQMVYFKFYVTISIHKAIQSIRSLALRVCMSLLLPFCSYSRSLHITKVLWITQNEFQNIFVKHSIFFAVSRSLHSRWIYAVIVVGVLVVEPNMLLRVYIYIYIQIDGQMYRYMHIIFACIHDNNKMENEEGHEYTHRTGYKSMN